jgi:hypothetical protein
MAEATVNLVFSGLASSASGAAAFLLALSLLRGLSFVLGMVSFLLSLCRRVRRIRLLR